MGARVILHNLRCIISSSRNFSDKVQPRATKIVCKAYHTIFLGVWGVEGLS